MSLPVSPLAPAAFPQMPALTGVTFAAHACGIRYKNRDDLLLMVLPANTTAAGVFTRSKCPSAPVDWCREALKKGKARARAVLVNAGNANAFTGEVGAASVARTVAKAAEVIGCAPEHVFVSSTGTIGEPLPDARITENLDTVFAKAMAGGDESGDWQKAAAAIMTTDTFPKGATRQATIDGVTVTINGIAKGSGMIAPDMATMLSYVVTDAALPADVLQALLTKATDKTFNCITVDSDTSTSDTLLLFATGTAGNKPVKDAADKRLKAFKAALTEVLLDLAQQVARDGEGASKFIEVRVTGAESARAAKRIAMTIADSPLVKTAIAGEDANWGRIVMAVGKAGEKADRDRLAIRIGGVEVAAKGRAVEGYDETPVVAHMKGKEIVLEVDIGLGKGKATVWTCDLTHGYIDINGSYRT
ncbi:bifunctional glutamate N-acetyltransferase/amino-acid acetyltransferase ArgJ [Caenispirillum bisanense]|uniref:Arginine biosynthesis bifunctional protein ArgJ n=1 Tax=Caenispirillum bisanense TaxID=414052 RepID=A0A286GJI1_9PROT|nr:bifunctional glutamate N-acetyltransferase/amino-acid acetyltransferase ArgJ [Caenispirillum bisanense]SOD95691.1 glutamate N-acetyltransferase [Caenispirillum bisanense]